MLYASQFFLLIVSFVFLFQLFREKNHFIPRIIVYNAIFDIIGYIGGYDVGISPLIRAALTYSFFAVYIGVSKPPMRRVHIFAVLFLLYTTLILINSSDISTSLRVHMRVSAYFIYMILCYDYYYKNPENISVLLSKLPIVLFVYVTYTVIANIFDLGNLYRDGDAVGALQTGQIVGDFLLQFSVCIVLIPLYLYVIKDLKSKIFMLVISGLSLTFLLASARRSSVMIVVLGFCFFILFFNFRKKAFLHSLPVIAVFSLFTIIFWGDIQSRYDARNREFSIEQIEEEGRTQEYFIVSEIVFSFSDPFFSWFGKDIYADKGVVPTMYAERVLHTDYGRVLHGMGIIGLFIYISFYIHMLINILLSKKKINTKIEVNSALYSSLLSLFFCKIVLLYVGGMHVISYNSLLFGFIMSLLGYINSKKSIEITEKHYA